MTYITIRTVREGPKDDPCYMYEAIVWLPDGNSASFTGNTYGQARCQAEHFLTERGINV